MSELQDELSLMTLFAVGTVKVFPHSVGVGVVEEVGLRQGVTDAARRWARGDAAIKGLKTANRSMRIIMIKIGLPGGWFMGRLTTETTL